MAKIHLPLLITKVCTLVSKISQGQAQQKRFYFCWFGGVLPRYHGKKAVRKQGFKMAFIVYLILYSAVRFFQPWLVYKYERILHRHFSDKGLSE